MLRFGAALVVVGLLLFGFGASAAYPILSSVASSPTHAVPGEFEQHLDEGVYVISVQTTSSTGSGPITFSRTRTVGVEQLSVSDPTGAAVTLSDGRNQSVVRNGTGFAGVAVFTADEPGVYVVELATSSETNALVTRTATLAVFAQSATAAVGSLAVLVGLVLVGVGFNRKKRHRQLPPPA